MKNFLSRSAAFSLVELTLALGIAAFCLIAVLGLMPVAALTNRNATSQSAATNIIASVIADMRATTSSTSPQYGVTFGTPKTLYFDGAGQFTTSLGANSRYRVRVTFPSSPPGLSYAGVKATWPAPVDPATTTPGGSVEIFAAFDRNGL
jgi:uncharacterized protein (TIGR02598 family)